MFIDIIGWIMIIVAVIMVVSAFMKNDKGEKLKKSERAYLVIFALAIVFIGMFATGHTKRVATAHRAAVRSSKAAVRSSKIASSKTESREKASFSKSVSEAKSSTSSSSSSSKQDIQGFQKSVQELASNSGDQASFDDDTSVKITVSDDMAGNTYDNKKQFANGIITRIDKIGNMCDLNSVPFVYIQTQSGDNIARTTITGGIKVYD